MLVRALNINIYSSKSILRGLIKNIQYSKSNINLEHAEHSGPLRK